MTSNSSPSYLQPAPQIWAAQTQDRAGQRAAGQGAAGQRAAGQISSLVQYHLNATQDSRMPANGSLQQYQIVQWSFPINPGASANSVYNSACFPLGFYPDFAQPNSTNPVPHPMQPFPYSPPDQKQEGYICQLVTEPGHPGYGYIRSNSGNWNERYFFCSRFIDAEKLKFSNLRVGMHVKFKPAFPNDGGRSLIATEIE